MKLKQALDILFTGIVTIDSNISINHQNISATIEEINTNPSDNDPVEKYPVIVFSPKIFQFSFLIILSSIVIIVFFLIYSALAKLEIPCFVEGLLPSLIAALCLILNVLIKSEIRPQK